MTNPITLYYRATVSPTDLKSNAVTTDIVSIIDGVEYNTYYTANSVRLMMNEDGTPNYESVINFLGFRTPADASVGLLPLYNETVTIQTKTGNITGTAIYVDNGEGFVSQTPVIEYAVGSNSGEFAGAKILTIFIDNINYTRKVVITF